MSDIPYRTLGSTGEKVSLAGLGGAHIGMLEDEQESIRIIRTAIDNGITFMDADGNRTGPLDESDWGFQGNWTDQAFDLFGGEEGNFCKDADEQAAYVAAPNPATAQSVFGYQLKDSSDLEIKVVDKNYQVLYETEVRNTFGPGYNELRIDWNEIDLKDTVRVFYKVIQKDCEMRGHGDVLLQ